jgi:hypothetical protein
LFVVVAAVLGTTVPANSPPARIADNNELFIGFALGRLLETFTS